MTELGGKGEHHVTALTPDTCARRVSLFHVLSVQAGRTGDGGGEREDGEGKQARDVRPMTDCEPMLLGGVVSSAPAASSKITLKRYFHIGGSRGRRLRQR